jgi:hypothetical protein
MRTIGIVAVVAAMVGVFGYVNEWFNPRVELNVDPSVNQKVETLTSDTIDTAQEQTNKAFNAIKSKLNKERK